VIPRGQPPAQAAIPPVSPRDLRRPRPTPVGAGDPDTASGSAAPLATATHQSLSQIEPEQLDPKQIDPKQIRPRAQRVTRQAGGAVPQSVGPPEPAHTNRPQNFPDDPSRRGPGSIFRRRSGSRSTSPGIAIVSGDSGVRACRAVNPGQTDSLPPD